MPQHSARQKSKYSGMKDRIMNDSCPSDHYSHVFFTRGYSGLNAQKTLEDFIQVFHKYLLSLLCGKDMKLGSTNTQQEYNRFIFLHCCMWSNIICPQKSSVVILGNIVAIYVWTS